VPCDARLDREEPVRADHLGLALERERVDGLRDDRIPREVERLLADEDLAGGRGLLEPGGGVHGVAGDEVLTRRGVAGDDGAGVHADPRLERQGPLALEVQALAEGRGPGDVTEHDRDGLAHLASTWRRGEQVRAALGAEFGPVGVLVAAVLG
jgi:hypothetical protein